MPNCRRCRWDIRRASGNGTIYGTDEETNSTNRLFNVHSNYQIAGFRLNAFFTHNSLTIRSFRNFFRGSRLPCRILSGHDVGFGAQHDLPLHGPFYANYNRASADSNYLSNAGQTYQRVQLYGRHRKRRAPAFTPRKTHLMSTQNYTNNLSGYLAQSLGNGAATPAINLGLARTPSTMGGGASYQFTNYLSALGAGDLLRSILFRTRPTRAPI